MAGGKTSRKGRTRWIILLTIVGVGVVATGGYVYRRLNPSAETLHQKGQLFREYNNTKAASEFFRRALKADPAFVDARIALIQTLAARKEYEEAEAELDAAVRAGFDDEQVLVLKGEIATYKAENRLREAGTVITPELCNTVIAEHIHPAAEIIRNSPVWREPHARVLVTLGNLHNLEARVLLTKWTVLLQARALARDLKKTEEIAAHEARIREVLAEVRRVERAAAEAYQRAMEKDPEAIAPRVALAEYSLGSFVPRPQAARELLAPLLDRNPVPMRILQLMASVERASNNREKALEYVRRIDSDRVDYATRALEADLLIEMGKGIEADPIVEELMKLKPNEPFLGLAKGQILLAQGRTSEAINYLQNLFVSEKMRWPKARITLARALLKEGHTEQAVTAYQKAIEDARAAQPTSLRMQNELRDIQYEANRELALMLRQRSTRNAADHAKRALILNAGRPEALQLAVETATAAGLSGEEIEEYSLLHAVALVGARDLDGAVAVCRREIEARGSGKNGRLRLLLARLQARQGAFRDAIASYNHLRREFPAHAAVNYELAALHTRLGQHQDAQTVLHGVLATNPGDVRAISSLVVQLLRSGDAAGATRLLKQADSGGASSEALRALLIEAYLRQGQPEEAVALARKQVDAAPDSVVARVVLGELLARQDKLPEAGEAFDEALRLSPRYLPAYRRAILHLIEDRPTAAATLLEEARKHFPQDAGVVMGLAIALQAAGERQKASEMLEGYLQGLSGPAQQTADIPRWYLAILRAGEGDLARAQEISNAMRPGELWLGEDRSALLETIAQSGPKAVTASAQLNLLLLFNSTGFQKAALGCATVLETMLPNKPLFACWHARLLDEAGRHAEAQERYERVMRDHERFTLARVLLGDSLQRRRETDKAIDVMESALPLASPERAAWLHLQLGRTHEAMERFDEAMSHYQAARAKGFFSAHASNNLAWIVATHKGDLEAALPFAQEAVRAAPGEPAILDTYGWVRHLRGENDEALVALERARSGLPGNPTVRYHYGMALLKASRPADAKREFEEALALNADFPEAADAMQKLAGLVDTRRE